MLERTDSGDEEDEDYDSQIDDDDSQPQEERRKRYRYLSSAENLTGSTVPKSLGEAPGTVASWSVLVMGRQVVTTLLRE